MVDQPSRTHAPDGALDELARSEPSAGHRSLLVVFPKTACSGSARMVVLDDERTFYGALAPGEAALLEVPEKQAQLVVVSNVEVEAAPRTWSHVDRVDVPPAPGGLLFESTWATARTCFSGHYADITVATKQELEETLASSEVRWRTPRRAIGQAWIDQHRERVGELVGKGRLARLP